MMLYDKGLRKLREAAGSGLAGLRRLVLSDEVSIDSLLQDHFKTDISKLPIFEQTFPAYDRPNLHLALEELMAKIDPSAVLSGIVCGDDYDNLTLARLVNEDSASRFNLGPVQYIDLPLVDDRTVSCLRRGLYLLQESKIAVAILIRDERYTSLPGTVVEVMAGEKDLAQKILRRIASATLYGKAFRGQVLSVASDCYGHITVGFHKLPSVQRESMILPEAVMTTLERLTIGFTAQAQRLKRAGRHLKRGILLHGPPGTGKTMSAMYLASRMKERTVLILTGQGVGAIDVACRLARALEPSTVILEDVDLVALERTRQTVDANALLFELLNQMDGLAEDADLLFILTTNRPDILEPALAARPGRIDQAIAIPVPDEECRRRLFALYGEGLGIPAHVAERYVVRMEGASGAFVREFLRKAALVAAEAGGEDTIRVEEIHMETAFSELVLAGGQLTQSLLGADIRKVGSS